MPQDPDFDTTSAHRYFSAQCFNACWKLLDLPSRSPEQATQLIALGHASHWHWTQRSDCTPKNLSVAHWMLARIYAVLGDAAQARHYAEACLRLGQAGGVAPFYLGCAHEALARAALIRGDRAEAEAQLAKVQSFADAVDDAEGRKILLDDLASLQLALDVP